MNKEVIKTGSFESIPGKILILGSRATFNSLRRGMYYTSDESGNIIWDILDDAFSDIHANFKDLQHQLINLFDSGKDTTGIKKQMINLLAKCNIGLSDVLFECESTDSLDTSIQNGVVNPKLEALCANADVVLLNGGTAANFFRKESKKWKRTINFFVMPSTSNTPGRYVKPKNTRIEEWSEMIRRYKK